jgi:hypothetical protein
MKKNSKKQPELTQEEQNAARLKSDIENIKQRVDSGYIPKKPTRLFKVGDSVKIGALQNTTVTEVLFGGLGYAVHYDYIGSSYGNPKRVTGVGAWDWTHVLPMTSYCAGEILSVKDDVDIRFFNNSIDSLLSKVYYSGVDFNPNYQRDLVWTMKQKISLLDSIFNNIEIGKFTFIKHEYSVDRVFYYEILDGKQRLSTICEFYEDRFAWKGKKFSELCARDANHFCNFPIVQGEVGEITEQQVYKLFIKMNTSGTPVSQDHLDKIKSLIK